MADYEFSKRLRKLRADRNMGVEEVAFKAGVSASRFRNWEHGSVPDDEEDLMKLAVFFAVSTVWLKTGKQG